MKIIDLNNVERIIKDCPVIVSHTRKNSVVANKFENIDEELVRKSTTGTRYLPGSTVTVILIEDIIVS